MVTHPTEFLKHIRGESLRVKPPSDVVFLCGGKLDPLLERPTVLRDTFFRISKDAPPDYKIILAEAANPLVADAGYGDLLSFESDIAQVVGLILLFVESPGSLAEFGAFAALKTVAPSLLAVLLDFYYERESFVRNGPIKFLENSYGEQWIVSLDTEDLGIGADGSIEGINEIKFYEGLTPIIGKRLGERAHTQKFDPRNTGHIILLITGLCQEFGALTITEIEEYLGHFGAERHNRRRLFNFLYCAELLGWLKRVRKGNNIFYVATNIGAALEFNFNEGVPFRDKVRWRADIRSYWQANDVPRLRAIKEVMAAEEGVAA